MPSTFRESLSPPPTRRDTSSPRSWSSPSRDSPSVSALVRGTHSESSPRGGSGAACPSEPSKNPTSSPAIGKTTSRWSDAGHNSESSFGTESSNIKSARSSLSRLLGGKMSQTNGRHSVSGSARDTQPSHMSDLDGGRKSFDSGQDDAQHRVSSGSSSDSSLPPLSSPSASPSTVKADVSSASSSMRLPRFCHECGHKYPVLLAKFCCQCGSRRPSVDS